MPGNHAKSNPTTAIAATIQLLSGPVLVLGAPSNVVRMMFLNVAAATSRPLRAGADDSAATRITQSEPTICLGRGNYLAPH
jgi:hypothetical protein